MADNYFASVLKTKFEDTKAQYIELQKNAEFLIEKENVQNANLL